MVLSIATSAVAATDDGEVTAFATTTCDSCSDCTKKLNGDYDTVILTTDLINVKGSGITFGADNVVFDGSGHIIDGDDSGEFESGITMNGKSGNTIKNCVITDFESGITLYGSSKNEIYENEISSNYYDGIWISEESNSNNIHNNIIEDNGKYGVFFSSNSDGNTFSENTVCSNPTDIHDSAKNSGDDNVCDTTDNWNDDDVRGCTRDCASRKPDLVITDISNDYGTICYQIENIGDATASEGHYTTLFVDGLYQIKEQVDLDLAPGASVERCFNYYSWSCTSPEDVVGVCADYGDFVNEGNEENNCMEAVFECAQPELECVDFEDLLMGAVYHVVDVFTDSGATITVLPFQWDNKNWTSDGYAEIENNGNAGGSGQEMWVNNVNLDFDFGSSCSGISLLFGEYGGNLNIEINGDFRNFEDFVDINGLNIGGANVLVINGFGNDKGSLKLSGTINSLVIGGQELCIDDVCPTEGVPDLIVAINGPEKVIAGENVALEVIVSNIGSATAPGSIESEVVYYVVDLILSSDNNIPLELAVYPVYAGKTREDFVEDMLLEGGRISRTESISPGGSVSYTLDLYIPEKTSPGIHCLGAVVDPAEAVEELSEENNIYCHKINILPPETPPALPPEKVDFWVMPYAVGRTTLDNINANGLTNYTDWKSGYTMVYAPFGDRLGLRHGYDSRIPTNEIMYYRWSYKHENETKWQEFSEPVNVHYVKDDNGVLTFPVYSLGPKGINGMNLYEFRPHNAPDVCESMGDCETYWPTTDWFADIYSGFLESNAISNGKHDIKLEVYDNAGNQVMPDGIKFEFIVPTGVDGNGTILTRKNTSGEIDNGGFVFPLHIDNRKCSAVIDAPAIGTIGIADECGFLRYSPGDETVHIAFHATHPDNFALFNFYIIRGTTKVTSVVGGEAGAHSVGNYTGDGYGNFENETAIELLRGSCTEAAFSENLHVYAKATTGWGHRINEYDAHAVRAFALSPI
ncbi:MAG: CARDB domain-containing protein [Euryarchaeota archaeon]|nr:CARDB domain-containing protein [Euryarchaeota archaeon]